MQCPVSDSPCGHTACPDSRFHPISQNPAISPFSIATIVLCAGKMRPMPANQPLRSPMHPVVPANSPRSEKRVPPSVHSQKVCILEAAYAVLMKLDSLYHGKRSYLRPISHITHKDSISGGNEALLAVPIDSQLCWFLYSEPEALSLWLIKSFID